MKKLSIKTIWKWIRHKGSEVRNKRQKVQDKYEHWFDVLCTFFAFFFFVSDLILGGFCLSIGNTSAALVSFLTALLYVASWLFFRSMPDFEQKNESIYPEDSEEKTAEKAIDRNDSLVEWSASDAGMYACQGRKVPIEIIRQWLESPDIGVRVAAIEACEGREIPIEIIQQGLEDDEWIVRAAAIGACQGREISIEIIQQGLQDDEWGVRVAAMNACRGREIPIEIIQQGLQDDTLNVSVAAMEACQGREVPFEIIRQWVENEKSHIREGAMEECREQAGGHIEIVQGEQGDEYYGYYDEDDESDWEIQYLECHVREAVIYACQGREIPPEIMNLIS